MNCPLPRYYMCHAVVALLITGFIALACWPFLGWRIGVIVGLPAGVAFYIGREFTQWEQGGGPGLPFDWRGIAAPFAACVTVLAAMILI